MQFGSIKTEKGDFLIEIESDTINCVNVCEEDMTTLVRVVLILIVVPNGASGGEMQFTFEQNAPIILSMCYR